MQKDIEKPIASSPELDQVFKVVLRSPLLDKACVEMDMARDPLGMFAGITYGQ